MVAWLLKCNISRHFFLTSKFFLKQCETYISCVQNRLFISSECPFHTLGPVRLIFSSIHHYIIFLWLQRSTGQPKVIFLLISKNHNKKTDNQKKDFDRTGPPT